MQGKGFLPTDFFAFTGCCALPLHAHFLHLSLTIKKLQSLLWLYKSTGGLSHCIFLQVLEWKLPIHKKCSLYLQWLCNLCERLASVFILF